MYTTALAPIDMDAVFPQLAAFKRITTRLHPRKGSPSVDHGSVGGPLLWPTDEPWPTCDDAGLDEHPADTPMPLVPVLQLFAEDIPDLPFPEGSDVLQVLWCPFDHYPSSAPVPRLRWRRRSTIGPRLAAMPNPHPDADTRYVPDPCAIDPEQVVEYPSYDLPEEVWSQIRNTLVRVEADTGWQYDTDLAVASGIKTGGYPGWTQSPDWPICDCGIQMEHLLTIASWEFSRGDEHRWPPLENRHAMTGWNFDSPNDHPWRALQNPTGLMLGDAGGIYVFVCTSCPNRPYDHRFDCS
ncbi:hypothetical protein OG792_08565 [Micromonospora sp. NBC_01699]|uniref:hypothetical protein n=1 Tax=Micromonospora sp. NBC_01699 TaxID=2975984 RepID=UPI002E338A55|nr:hypothetical protein [Micromonospora sp. NBC_01699]